VVTRVSTMTDPERFDKRARTNSMYSACYRAVRVQGADSGGLAALNVRAPGDLGKKHIGSSDSLRASNSGRKPEYLDLKRAF